MPSRRTILLSFLFVGILCLVLGYFGSRSWLQQHRTRRAAEELALQAVAIASFVDDPTLPPGDRLLQLPRERPFEATVLDPAGRVVATTEAGIKVGERAAFPQSQDEFLQALNSKFGTALRYDSGSNTWKLTAVVSLKRTSGFLRLSRALDPEPASESKLPLLFLVLGAILVVSAWVAMALIFKLSDRAVENLSLQLERAADKDLPSLHPPGPGNELAPLVGRLETLLNGQAEKLSLLQAKHNDLTTVLESMQEAVLVTDSSGRISLTNRAFGQLFQPPVSAPGRKPLEVVRIPEIEAGVSQAFQEQRLSEQQMRFHDRSLLARFAPVRSSAGDVLGVVAVFHDVTELRRLERVRRDFVSNVSHELKSPLTAIRGFAETLADDPTLQERPHRFAGKILDNSRQLAAIIDELLQLARLEKEEPLQRQEIDFDLFCSELHSSLAAELRQTENVLTVSNRSERRIFTANEAYFRRVLVNLLDNALKHTQGGKVEIELTDVPEGVQVKVSDTGTGIPEESLERIFERFYRVKRDRSQDRAGSGVGLAIVKHIVQLHGGRVWASSRLGEGTSIFFTIPQ